MAGRQNNSREMAEVESFVRTMAELGDRLGPLLLQLRREFPEGHTHLKKNRDDDLLWWSRLVDRFLQEGRIVFAYANNHYQNHSPSTLERFLEIRRGDR